MLSDALRAGEPHATGANGHVVQWRSHVPIGMFGLADRKHDHTATLLSSHLSLRLSGHWKKRHLRSFMGRWTQYDEVGLSWPTASVHILITSVRLLFV